MKVELTHDIIAEKIWEKLPEQDKQLRLIRDSLRQRFLDFQKQSGSLLGEKELISWEDYFILLDLPAEQQQFIAQSKAAVQQKKQAEQQQKERELQLTRQKLEVEQKARKKQRYFLVRLGILAIAAVITSILAINSRKIAKENETAAKEKQQEVENANVRTGESIKNLARIEYQTNLDEATFYYENLDLQNASSAANAAIAVLDKYIPALEELEISKANAEQLKIFLDSNARQARALINQLEEKLPGFPSYLKFIEEAKKLEKEKKYILARQAYQSAKEAMETEQVNLDILRVEQNGFRYYKNKGQGHMESGTKQDVKLAADYFQQALQLRNEATTRALLKEAQIKFDSLN